MKSILEMNLFLIIQKNLSMDIHQKVFVMIMRLPPISPL